MIISFLRLSILLFVAAQETSPAPWGTDAGAARESALQGKRPCVMVLFADSL